jgi:hypothetical protein
VASADVATHSGELVAKGIFDLSKQWLVSPKGKWSDPEHRPAVTMLIERAAIALDVDG